MIYHLHLTSTRIIPRHTALTKRWTPIDLLYTSRTIYHEAFFHLYTQGKFVLVVRPEIIFGLATCRGANDVSASFGLELFMKSQKIQDLIKQIELEIHWPSVEYAKLMDLDYSQDAPTTDSMLKQTMFTVGAMLSELPGLRTIDISWFHMALFAWEVTEVVPPPTYKTRLWLRGLKQVRRKNENVLIRMPSNGPISTKDLAEEQEDRGEISNRFREIREDIRELQGCLREEFY